MSTHMIYDAYGGKGSWSVRHKASCSLRATSIIYGWSKCPAGDTCIRDRTEDRTFDEISSTATITFVKDTMHIYIYVFFCMILLFLRG